MNAVIYIRTSTQEQNPENQIKDIKTLFSADANPEIVREQQSAWKDKERPGFSKIYNAVKQGEIKHIYCWDLDRLYRRRKKLVAFMKLCKAFNVQVHSFRQQWLEQLNKAPNPWNEIMTDLMLQIMGWMAEDESKQKSERIRNAVRHKQGKTVSYKGNAWGKKGFSKQTIDRVIALKKEYPNWSIREIAEHSYYYDQAKNKKKMSKSAVHKILNENTSQNFVL